MGLKRKSILIGIFHHKMAQTDLLNEISNKEELFAHYYDNFEKHLALGKTAKASEFLWGALHCLIYAIGITYGKKLNNHNKVLLFAKEISEGAKDGEIYLAVKIGEELHANFYHDFLDKDGLNLKRVEVDKLIMKLRRILEERKELIKKEFVEDTPEDRLLDLPLE